mmetsp:Transcript_14438/g.39473  ORF Transcript_14438/g.39473 Transcript_14438/m.39473 type:complete len:233 (-) Transcript_14438:113-811(-)
MFARTSACMQRAHAVGGCCSMAFVSGHCPKAAQHAAWRRPQHVFGTVAGILPVASNDSSAADAEWKLGTASVVETATSRWHCFRRSGLRPSVCGERSRCGPWHTEFHVWRQPCDLFAWSTRRWPLLGAACWHSGTGAKLGSRRGAFVGSARSSFTATCGAATCPASWSGARRVPRDRRVPYSGLSAGWPSPSASLFSHKAWTEQRGRAVFVRCDVISTELADMVWATWTSHR